MYLFLSKKQKKAIDLIKQGHNVFITGAAGTGKSYLLKYLKDEYEHLHITASTGIAAVNIGGQTLYSWAALGIGNLPIQEILRILLSSKCAKIRNKLIKAKMLAIDEISMIPVHIFDLLNNILKILRRNNNPFGGLQIILFGDFLQLPPVKQENEVETTFCFESETWQESNIMCIELDDIFRQKEKKLINLLNNIRFGKLTQTDIETLNKCKNKIDKKPIIEPIIIGTHNNQIENINNEKLKKLRTEEKTYDAKFSGTEKQIEFLKKHCIAREKLIIKTNAQVMMLKNTHAENGIINGSIGNVVSFSKNDFPIVEFLNGEKIEVGIENWTVEKFNEDTRKIEIEAIMYQVPLILAWAITVHKSQGMTLDKIKCDLERSFAEGQIYVALSRIKTLDGLFLDSFDFNNIRANKKVIEFYKNISVQ